MKSEMSLMHMDERQRLVWFMANRGTLIAVGAAWIGMIGWELTHERVPTFLLIMVPLFAILRAGLYAFYSTKPLVETDSSESKNYLLYGKIIATIFLVVAISLPIYSTQQLLGDETGSSYAWNLIQNDGTTIFPLTFAYLWPLIIYGLSKLNNRKLFVGLIQYTEPAFAIFSSIIILWIPQLVFETTTLLGIIIIPVNSVPAYGCYLVVAANSLYLVSWLAGLLSPWTVQEC